MKTSMKRIIAFLLVIVSLTLTLASCKVDVTPTVHIGFKPNGNAGEYDESIQNLLVGKEFHGIVKITLLTDKEASEEYQVVIELPKTKEVEATRSGGLKADSIVVDGDKSILTFTMKGSKNAKEEPVHFKGTPTGEGEVVIDVMIYDKNGLAINAGYDKTIRFVYELED